ncbi:hypothetical protein GCM10010967_27840 [Dyadobacter beijingensis]|uniref:1,4-alpha-glucan branching enzyme n=2 Tax=Dyadobacter beijingensis TaxID=365489 RepID=A0ABQ2HVV8_9BACT|nr:hypothetical protein GCM10010967_27840 [Dyadobacter beijingensis]
MVLNQSTETMATTKSNTKEAPSKMKAMAAEKSSGAKATTAKATTKAATKDTTKSTTKSTASKSSAKTKSAADTTASARAAGKKVSSGSAKSGSSKKSAGDSKSNTSTRDHDTIRHWVEQRGGVPSVVKGTAKKKDGGGILRIDFPGYSGEDSLEEISWDEFFQKFDDSKLEFLYQEKTADGKESRFNKFVSSN